VPLQEAHLMPEKFLGDLLARGLVAGTGQVTVTAGANLRVDLPNLCQ